MNLNKMIKLPLYFKENHEQYYYIKENSEYLYCEADRQDFYIETDKLLKYCSRENPDLLIETLIFCIKNDIPLFYYLYDYFDIIIKNKDKLIVINENLEKDFEFAFLEKIVKVEFDLNKEVQYMICFLFEENKYAIVRRESSRYADDPSYISRVIKKFCSLKELKKYIGCEF